jgi:hypothetical protein
VSPSPIAGTGTLETETRPYGLGGVCSTSWYASVVGLRLVAAGSVAVAFAYGQLAGRCGVVARAQRFDRTQYP